MVFCAFEIKWTHLLFFIIKYNSYPWSVPGKNCKCKWILSSVLLSVVLFLIWIIYIPLLIFLQNFTVRFFSHNNFCIVIKKIKYTPIIIIMIPMASPIIRCFLSLKHARSELNLSVGIDDAVSFLLLLPFLFWCRGGVSRVNTLSPPWQPDIALKSDPGQG